MKVLAFDDSRPVPKEFYEDFVRLLHNGYSEMQLRMACLRFGKLEKFGFIIPRKFLASITCPYDMEEMSYTGFTPQDEEIYRHWDAVMIKNKTANVL